jgi:hypothetical protein
VERREPSPRPSPARAGEGEDAPLLTCDSPAPEGRKDRKAADKPGTAAARPFGKHPAVKAAGRDGKPPEPPDFTAETHKRLRNKFASVVELAKAGGLRS